MITTIVVLIGFIGNIATQEPYSDDNSGETLYREAMAFENNMPPDSAGAFRLYLQSANTGFVPAMRYLGYLYYEGKGIKRDIPQSIQWLKKAAEKGDAASWENLGWIYRHGLNDYRSDKKAFEAFTKAARDNRPESVFELAQMTLAGQGTECDTLKAIQYYEQAIQCNHNDADDSLSRLTEWRMTQISPDSALNLAKKYFYWKAPKTGVAFLSKLSHLAPSEIRSLSAQTKTILAQALSLGRGTDYNPALSLEFYYQAATGGDPTAQFIIAELLESFPDALDSIIGETIEKENHKSSQYWREKAAESGILTADEAEKRLQTL